MNAVYILAGLGLFYSLLVAGVLAWAVWRAVRRWD